MEAFELFVVLVAIAALVYAATLVPSLQGVFRFLPPVVWLYFVPMALTTAGLLPREHELYGAMATYALPLALLLLTVSLDIDAVMSVGKPAIIGMFVGTARVAIGCIFAMLAVGSLLPSHGWQGLAMLSATWIGGSANMVSIQQSLGAPAEAVGPVVVVDTVLGYGWLSGLILLSAWQKPLGSGLNWPTR
jgi:uncharacterized membrane protein